MIKNISRKSLLILFTIIIISCNSNVKSPLSGPVFTSLDATQTNIDFVNSIKDERNANILIYESFYNGGGVAIGDINNDGLQDLYFAGNQVGDKLYLNQGDFVFKDITDSAGILNKGGWSSGVTMVDINNDGHLDIYVCKTLYDESPDLRKNELYINNGNGTFTENAAKWGLDDVWRTMDSVFLDYDNDGLQDVFIVNQPPNPGFLSPLRGQNWLQPQFSCRLLKNKGNVFEDVSEQAGVLQKGYGLSATASDFNNDGHIDIYVANDYDTPDFLYINQGDGTFTNEINESMGHISYFSMGTDAGDINNDGLSDLVTLDMVASDNYRLKANMSGMNPDKFWSIVNAGGHYQYMFNTLQLNHGLDSDGQLKFGDIAQMSDISRTDWSWSPLIADFDNDGHKDIFITNGIKKDLRNNDAVKKSEKFFHKKIQEFAQKNPDTRIRDYLEVVDYNELIDILPSKKLSNFLFHNTADLTFTQKQEEWGLATPSFSSGAAYGDLDNDGDLDLIVSNVDAPPFIYKNNSSGHEGGNFIKIKTENEKGLNLNGVKVTLEYNGKKQFAESRSSRGFYSSSDNTVHFGTNDVTNIEKILVDWPNGKQTILNNVKVNQTLVVNIKEGIEPVPNSSSEPIFVADNNNGIDFSHQENSYDDYAKELLLPHKMSTQGGGSAVGDINNDGIDDIYFSGAKDQAGALYVSGPSGKYTRFNQNDFERDKSYEDMGALFFDADNDKDLDLYVASGGNESEDLKYYQDRLYINDGNGNFSNKTQKHLPQITISGSKVRQNDIDGDGDLDLLICGRQNPGNYPLPTSSLILINEGGQFVDKTSEIAPELLDLGMVTDAIWSDFDKDGIKDLIVVGEWMPLTFLANENGKLVDKTSGLGMQDKTGWWFAIEEGDFDNDGDMDYLIGNLGLNYKYKASPEEPFEVYAKDFDENGSLDIVLSYYENGISYPVRGRQCSSEQMPFIKDKFKDYDAFASSSLTEVYQSTGLNDAFNLKANSFASVLIENVEGKSFVPHTLPNYTQISSINDFLVQDFNNDGFLDFLYGGNLFNAEVETAKNDAGVGGLMLGNGKLQFNIYPKEKSGFLSDKEIKEILNLNNKEGQKIILNANNAPVQTFIF
ncbi:VCBS repeat-containing protein [Sediminicola luteus]|uniref:ASPIC/UnbV domain-containing protein n=1 Tax=Sediminicola luteus TaxID=319238 RepID=A0A2A4G6Q1_9FLAO|nr:VCBS repeat-containing protein [Sediminicola luteus]PCE63634.1 hypothetical protein B7P33_10135 [Sediminicola luteus]